MALNLPGTASIQACPHPFEQHICPSGQISSVLQNSTQAPACPSGITGHITEELDNNSNNNNNNNNNNINNNNNNNNNDNNNNNNNNKIIILIIIIIIIMLEIK